MLKRIESKEDLLLWAKSVNLQDLRKISDLQDVFARSTMNDMKRYFMDLEQNDKELVVFSISKCMGSANLFEFVKVYASHKAQIYIDKEGAANNHRALELAMEEGKLRIKEDSYKSTIATLEAQNTELINDNNDMTQKVSDQVKRIWAFEAEVEELEKDLKECRAFEAHIKKHLQS